MTLDEAIKHAEEVMTENLEKTKDRNASDPIAINCFECAKEQRQLAAWLKDYKRLLEQQPCEMTAEEYRKRMIQAFHNADCDELIALVVLPTEKEFEHLEWLLEKHYKAKPEPCADAISRQAVIDALNKTSGIRGDALKALYDLSPVTPQPEMGHWIDDKCSACGKGIEDLIASPEWYRNEKPNFCPFCGLRLVDSQEREE